MFRAALLALFTGLVVLTGGTVAQDPKTKQDPKTEVKKDDKKDEPAGKVKGTLPANYGKLGLTDAQVQEIYRTRNKYNDEIAKLKNKIAELETTRDKETKAVLTAEQKKRLDDILIGKDK